jgi:hypothetical protein
MTEILFNHYLISDEDNKSEIQKVISTCDKQNVFNIMSLLPSLKTINPDTVALMFHVSQRAICDLFD